MRCLRAASRKTASVRPTGCTATTRPFRSIVSLRVRVASSSLRSFEEGYGGFSSEVGVRSLAPELTPTGLGVGSGTAAGPGPGGGPGCAVGPVGNVGLDCGGIGVGSCVTVGPGCDLGGCAVVGFGGGGGG